MAKSGALEMQLPSEADPSLRGIYVNFCLGICCALTGKKSSHTLKIDPH